MYAMRKHVRNDENACSRMQMDIRTCETPMLKSTRYHERNDGGPKRRANFRRQQMCVVFGERESILYDDLFQLPKHLYEKKK